MNRLLLHSIFPVYDENTAAYPEKFASPAQVGYSTYFGNPVATAYYNNAKSNIRQFLPTSLCGVISLPQNRLTFKTSYNQNISSESGRIYTPEFRVGGGQKTRFPLNKYNNNIRTGLLTIR